MRLLRTEFVKNPDEPLKLGEFLGAQIPPYAILSHTWGVEEVTLQDVVTSTQHPRHKAGFSKILGCCTRAAQDGYEYVHIFIPTVHHGFSPDIVPVLTSATFI